VKLNVYGNDPNIERTVVSYSGGTLTIRYGQQITDFEMTYFLPISISVVPVSGYRFSYWTYRLGSATATKYFDYENYPFEYDGTLDLFIHATSEEITSTDTVAKWDWFSSNGSADGQETINSLLALISGTPTTDFSHRVWNDIVNKVYDMLEYRELTWEGKDNTDYYTYSSTKMTSSNKKLFAKRYNTLLRNFKNVIKDIGSNYDTYLSYVNRGDVVYPYHILNFTDEINYWIDGL
jgi:hypothetical protein